MHSYEQGSLFCDLKKPICAGHFFLAAPTTQFAVAVSPDALQEGNGGFQALLEVKYSCLFIGKDDGRGWVWSPSVS